MAFARGGRPAPSTGSDDSIRFWDADSGKEVGCLDDHDSVVTSVSSTFTGRRILSGSYDGTVRLWETPQ